MTRFYLTAVSPSGAAGLFPLNVAAGWEGTNALRRRAPVARISTTTASTSRTASATGDDVVTGQFVSEAIADQTISGTVKGQIQARQSGGGGNAAAQLVIRVVNNDCSVVRGTLLDFDTSAYSNGFIVSGSPRNCKFPKGWTGAGTAVSDVTAQNGDRLVFEIGHRQHATPTGTVLTFLDNSATDLPEDETDTDATKNPWIELSHTVVFASFNGPGVPLWS